MATVQRFRGSDGKSYSITTNGNKQYLESNGNTLFSYDSYTNKTFRGNKASERVGDGNLLTSLLSALLG